MKETVKMTEERHTLSQHLFMPSGKSTGGFQKPTTSSRSWLAFFLRWCRLRRLQPLAVDDSLGGCGGRSPSHRRLAMRCQLVCVKSLQTKHPEGLPDKPLLGSWPLTYGVLSAFLGPSSYGLVAFCLTAEPTDDAHWSARPNANYCS